MGLQLTCRRTCYFLIFAFSRFSNFKWLLPKILQWISRVLRKFYYITNNFDLHIFDEDGGGPFKFLWNLHKNALSLFFLNEINITTSLSMMHLKCTVVYYSYLNSSSMNKLFLNYGPLNMSFRFFRFLVFVYFNEAFVKKKKKKKKKKLSFLNANFQNSFQDVVYYRILGCQTLWY